MDTFLQRTNCRQSFKKGNDVPGDQESALFDKFAHHVIRADVTSLNASTCLWGKCKECILSTSKRSKGKEKGKLEVNLWQKRKKSQRTQSGIEPGTPANATDSVPLSHRDKRYHQPVCFTILSALCPLHNIGIVQCPQLTNPFHSGDPSRSLLCIAHDLKEYRKTPLINTYVFSGLATAQVLILGGRTYFFFGGGGYDEAESKILLGRSLFNPVLSVHDTLLCMFQRLCTHFQDTGVLIFGGYVLSGHCNQQ